MEKYKILFHEAIKPRGFPSFNAETVHLLFCNTSIVSPSPFKHNHYVPLIVLSKPNKKNLKRKIKNDNNKKNVSKKVCNYSMLDFLKKVSTSNSSLQCSEKSGSFPIVTTKSGKAKVSCNVVANGNTSIPIGSSNKTGNIKNSFSGTNSVTAKPFNFASVSNINSSILKKSFQDSANNFSVSSNNSSSQNKIMVSSSIINDEIIASSNVNKSINTVSDDSLSLNYSNSILSTSVSQHYT